MDSSKHSPHPLYIHPPPPTPNLSDPATYEPTTSKLNQILQQQDTIKSDCRGIMENQSKAENPKQYVEYQAQLNNLFVQHMELGLKATGIIAAESLRAEAESSVDESVELTARTLSAVEIKDDEPSVDD